MKDSLATCLQHSWQQAQMTYDWPTANERMTMALELAKPKAEEGPADLEAVRPSHRWRSALGLCGTHCWGQHCTDDYNFPEVCSSIPAKRQGPSSVVQEHWRWHLYPWLGWWPVSGVKRVASCCEGGACQRACLWPATADHPVHETQSMVKSWTGSRNPNLQAGKGKPKQNENSKISLFF